MSVSREVRVAVARFLINNRLPANARPEDWYDIVFFLTEVVVGECNIKIEKYYANAIERMLALGWTNQKELDALAAQFENP